MRKADGALPVAGTSRFGLGRDEVLARAISNVVAKGPSGELEKWVKFAAKYHGLEVGVAFGKDLQHWLGKENLVTELRQRELAQHSGRRSSIFGRNLGGEHNSPEIASTDCHDRSVLRSIRQRQERSTHMSSAP